MLVYIQKIHICYYNNSYKNITIIMLMNDFTYILLYEFINQTYPFWSALIIYYIRYIIILIKKKHYVPFKNTINLHDVILTYNSSIIYSNRLNLDYYNISFYYDTKKINIIGNDKYLIINNTFYTLRFNINKYISNNNLNYSKFIIYLKPIIKYDSEECCVCFSEQGSLIGLCGHQNVCLVCQYQLNKCPVCNNPHMLINDNIEYIKI